jgi:aminopeptidase N
LAKQLSGQHFKGELSRAVNSTLYAYADEGEFGSLAARFDKLPIGNSKFMLLQPFANFLKRVKNTENFKKGIDMIVSFRDTIPEEYGEQLTYYINSMILSGISSVKQKAGLTEQAEYVKSKLAVKPVLK